MFRCITVALVCAAARGVARAGPHAPGRAQAITSGQAVARAFRVAPPTETAA